MHEDTPYLYYGKANYTLEPEVKSLCSILYNQG